MMEEIRLNEVRSARLFHDEQYEFCCQDAACQLNFELSGCSSEYEHSRFDYMLDSMMNDLHLQPTWFEEQSNTISLQSLLRHHRFCLGNEIMELGRGCLCRHDRRCDIKKPADQRLAPWILALLVLLGLGVILYFGIRVLKRQKKIEKMLTKGRTPTQYTTLDQLVTAYDIDGTS
jgi:hypothetical protein